MSWDLSSGRDLELLLNQLQGKVSAGQRLDLFPRAEKLATAVYHDFSGPGISVGETVLSASASFETIGVQVFSGSNNWAVS